MLHEDYYFKEEVDNILRFLQGETIFPLFLSIFPTNICNHDCAFCTTVEQRSGKESFPWEKLKPILQQAARGGTKYIEICGGGEPLVYKHLDELLEECFRLNFNVNLVTNGSLLEEPIAQLIARTCYRVKISMDAVDDYTHKQIHRTAGTHFNKIVRNIENFIQLKTTSSNPFVVLSYVVYDDTIQYVEDFIKLGIRLKADMVDFTANTLIPETSTSAYLQKIKDIIDRDPAYQHKIRIRYHNSPPDEATPECNLPNPESLSKGIITATGDYYPNCHYISIKKHRFGNVLDYKNLESFFKESRIREIMKSLAFGTTDKVTKTLTTDNNLRLTDYLLKHDTAKPLIRKIIAQGQY